MFKKMMSVKNETRLWCRNILESILYRIVKKCDVLRTPEKIVFVCTGNICRSAFAEKLLKAEKNRPFKAIESCGLDVQVRSPSPTEAVRAAAKIGLDLKSHLSKGIEFCDLEGADLILAMEYRQYRKLVKLLPHKRRQVRLLREFASFPENLLCNIDDPFGLSQRHFDRCFEQIHRSIATIRASI